MTDFTSCAYGAAHDAIQPIGDHPSHNDSVYCNFTGADGLPGGVLRIGLRPNEGYGEASLVLPLGEAGTVFHYVRAPVETGAVLPGSPVWEAGPLRIEAVEPTRRWRLRYGGREARLLTDPSAFAAAPGATWRGSDAVEVEVDLAWDADFPVHALSDGGGVLPGTESGDLAYGTSHLEQFGRVAGEVRVGHRAWSLGGEPAFRDHSWGPRVWESAPDQDFVTVYCDDGRRVAAIANRAGGVETFHGVLFAPGSTSPTPLEGYELRTAYVGGEAMVPIGWTFAAGGEELTVDGEVAGWLPLRVGKDPPTRIAQTLLTLTGATPGRAKTDLTRPIA